MLLRWQDDICLLELEVAEATRAVLVTGKLRHLILAFKRVLVLIMLWCNRSDNAAQTAG